MKPLHFSLIVFAVLFLISWPDSYERYRNNLPIEKDPAYAVAVIEKASARPSGSNRLVSLKYRFAVEGRVYHGSTGEMAAVIASPFLDSGTIEVAYAASDPGHSIMRRAFHPGRTTRDFISSTLQCVFLGLLFAVPLGLIVWLLRTLRDRRQAGVEKRQAGSGQAPAPKSGTDVASGPALYVRSKVTSASGPARATGSAPRRAPAPEDEAKGNALRRAIEEQKKTDPLAGAKVGGPDVCMRIVEAMKTERGVHTESLLCALGALAGYSCQASLRGESITRGEGADASFEVVIDKQGRRYFFGDLLNQRLAEGMYSVWNIANSGVRADGLETLPDLLEIFSHVTATVGDEGFGLVRFPEGHNAGDLPVNYLKGLWPVVLPIVKEYAGTPEEWPMLFGCALQHAIGMANDVLPPELALKLVMESASPMSKVDLSSA